MDWDARYRAADPNDLSWFEAVPETALDLIADANLPEAASAIDVGAGASRLAAHLIESGFAHVTLLDLSEAALEIARKALPEDAPVECVAGDVTTWTPDRHYDLWHDRAAFHFLSDGGDQTRYLETLSRALRPGGHVLLATFAPDAPPRCSGQPVVRRSVDELEAVLGPDFTPLAGRRQVHVTPSGVVQPFSYLLAQRGAG